MSLSEKQIIELESLLEDLETEMERCFKERLKQSEAIRIYNDFWQRASKIPEIDSDEWRTLDRIRKSTSAWWKESFSDYVVKKDCEHFVKFRDALKRLLEDNEPEFLRSHKRPKDQMFFAAGEVYEAKKALFEVMKGATTSLYVVDQYLDETIFDYLESLENEIQLKLLSGQTKPIFKTLLVSFANKRGNIEARICTECHDRFLLLDEKKAVHLGTSINFAGGKAFMLNTVTDSDEFNRLLNEFNSWWTKGQSIT